MVLTRLFASGGTVNGVYLFILEFGNYYLNRNLSFRVRLTTSLYQDILVVHLKGVARDGESRYGFNIIATAASYLLKAIHTTVSPTETYIFFVSLEVIQIPDM